MENKEANELRNNLVEKIGDEILELMYKEPKCDFEHTWNCAIDKAHDCLNGWEGSHKN